MKAKRIKKDNYQSEDQIEIKKFILIVVIILVLIVGVYFFTRIFVSKDLLNKKEDTTTPGVIDYNLTLVGSILNKPEKEYFVMMYNSSASDYVYYVGMASNYSQNEKAFKVYFADLDNELNKGYLGTEENAKTNNLEEFKVTGPTLIKIKEGKIVDAYLTKEDMSKALTVEED